MGVPVSCQDKTVSLGKLKPWPRLMGLLEVDIMTDGGDSFERKHEPR